MKKICFVCVGNTCRSPMAEKIFNSLIKKNQIKGIKAISAGISCENGVNMEIKSKRALKTLGYTCGAKKSVRLLKLEKNTLYIAMNEQIKQAINSDKVVSFKNLNLEEIPDPYGADQYVYDDTAKKIEKNIIVLIEKIQRII